MNKFNEKSKPEVIQKEMQRLTEQSRRALNRVAKLDGLLALQRGEKPRYNVDREVKAERTKAERTPRSQSVKNLVFQALAKSKHLPTEKVVDVIRAQKPDVNVGTVAASLSSLKRDGVVEYKNREYFATAKTRKVA